MALELKERYPYPYLHRRFASLTEIMDKMKERPMEFKDVVAIVCPRCGEEIELVKESPQVQEISSGPLTHCSFCDKLIEEWKCCTTSDLNGTNEKYFCSHECMNGYNRIQMEASMK